MVVERTYSAGTSEFNAVRVGRSASRPIVTGAADPRARTRDEKLLATLDPVAPTTRADEPRQYCEEKAAAGIAPS